ncbi:MAG: neutral zinc metallopeptidase [Parvularculaceae bacterium]
MRWQGRRKSKNVNDRRGEGGGMRMGAGNSGMLLFLAKFIFSKFGILGILVAGGGYFVMAKSGVDPLGLFPGGATQVSKEDRGDICEDEPEVCYVLASTEEIWQKEFAKRGATYPEPKLNIFSGGVGTKGCGYANSAVGPFYCPGDRQIYLDTAFFAELQNKLGAKGDAAVAYVIAHEVGHQIQTVSGTAAQIESAKRGRSKPDKNALQVRMELQADCYAGVWGHYTQREGIMQPGDLEEALGAANAIGDDTLQRNAGRRPMPDSFTHGTSEQRMRWFANGFQSGNMDSCDTLSAAQL